MEAQPTAVELPSVIEQADKTWRPIKDHPGLRIAALAGSLIIRYASPGEQTEAEKPLLKHL